MSKPAKIRVTKMRLSIMSTAEQEPDSVCYISSWHIPGGWDYVNAKVVVEYFTDITLAQQVENKHKDTPEMACLCLLV